MYDSDAALLVFYYIYVSLPPYPKFFEGRDQVLTYSLEMFMTTLIPVTCFISATIKFLSEREG